MGKKIQKMTWVEILHIIFMLALMLFIIKIIT